MKNIANLLVSEAQIHTTSAGRWWYALGNLGCAIPYQAVGAVLLNLLGGGVE